MTAIIYYSKHHGNTKKLLDAIAEADPEEELVYSAFRKVVDITDEEKEEVYKDLKSIYTHDTAMHYIKAIELLQERFGDSDE